MRMNTMA